MKKMRESYWILTFALVVLAICLYSDSVEIVEAQVSDEFVGPEACVTCHPSQYEDWEESDHSQAFTNDDFQDQWDSEGNPENCLECHTTGYDSSSGEYASENVSCESCHGAGYTMEVDRTPELCGSCHSGEYGKNRYEDFLEGTHATSGVVCADCHVSPEDHSLELVSDACATCHTGERIHSSSIMGDLQARAFTAEEITEQVQAEHDALVNEVSETEKRTQIITIMTYVGAGALGAVSLVIGVLYMKQKRV
jgi:DnaJ-class molecular chaperone